MATAELSPSTSPHHGGVSRRRVLAGTAWATPAILVGLAAPQAAASTNPGPTNPGGSTAAGDSSFRMDWSGAANLRLHLRTTTTFTAPANGFSSSSAHTLVLSLPAAYVATNASTGLPLAPANLQGWTLAGNPVLSGSVWQYTFASNRQWDIPELVLEVVRKGSIPLSTDVANVVISSRASNNAGAVVGGYSVAIPFTVPA
ncbi:hypothetical protein [Demequina sp.]|uniref:hypothetical protein n=1 Tax=Demequina sp. TaxID=2050685 RepID=UPI003A8897C9